jgi:glycosyltransferase involved in cell wall biosynthesis
VHEAGDVEALTRDLASLDRDRRLLRRMRERALAHRPELTWTKASERLEAIYRSRLSAPSRP